MNELTWKEMSDIVSGDATSGPNMTKIDAIGMDANSYADGPVQIKGGTLFTSAPILAATFNAILGQRWDVWLETMQFGLDFLNGLVLL